MRWARVVLTFIRYIFVGEIKLPKLASNDRYPPVYFVLISMHFLIVVRRMPNVVR